MQRLILLIGVTCSLLMFSCKPEVKKEENHKGYTIYGTLPNVNASLVYLLNEQNIKIDSVKVIDKKFLFKGFITKPETYSLQVKNEDKRHSIILENSPYNIFINNDTATVFGGYLNTRQVQFASLKNALNTKKIALLEAFMNGSIKSDVLYKSIDTINIEDKKNSTNYIIENADNLLSTAHFTSIKNFSLEELKNLNTNSKITETTILKRSLGEEITRLQIIADAAQLAEEKRVAASKKVYRKLAIMFNGEGVGGEMVSLASIIHGKKVVLIDFWASWCRPCRAVTPRVKRIYEKYKNKGFTILTVSEDKNKADWKNGIQQDKMLSWNHIFDDYGRISSMYGVRAIPYMVLIDGNGGIIKEKISVSELEYKLQQLL